MWHVLLKPGLCGLDAALPICIFSVALAQQWDCEDAFSAINKKYQLICQKAFSNLAGVRSRRGILFGCLMFSLAEEAKLVFDAKL